MKKVALILFSTLLLTACSNTQNNQAESSSSKSSTTTSKNTVKTSSKPNLNKKYPGFKLATIPTVFQGTWYQTDRYSKTARKFIITKHTIMDSVVYQKTDPNLNLNLNHRSEKNNKVYAGDATMISFEDKNGSQWLRARGFLDTVDIIYITGTFKGNECLYLAYSSGDIHSAMFKDKKAALKYRKYDFSKITNPLN